MKIIAMTAMTLIMITVAVIMTARRILPHVATLDLEHREGRDDGNSDIRMQSFEKNVCV